MARVLRWADSDMRLTTDYVWLVGVWWLVVVVVVGAIYEYNNR